MPPANTLVLGLAGWLSPLGEPAPRIGMSFSRANESRSVKAAGQRRPPRPRVKIAPGCWTSPIMKNGMIVQHVDCHPRVFRLERVALLLRTPTISSNSHVSMDDVSSIEVISYCPNWRSGSVPPLGRSLTSYMGNAGASDPHRHRQGDSCTGQGAFARPTRARGPLIASSRTFRPFSPFAVHRRSTRLERLEDQRRTLVEPAFHSRR